MTVLGFDLGREVGVAIGALGEVPALETHKLPRDIGALLHRFEGVVLGHMRRREITAIAWEEPFVNFKQPSKGQTTNIRQQFAQAGALARIAHGYGIPSSSYQPRTLRKRVCGRAGATEKEIIHAARIRDAHPRTNHEADAFLVWQVAADELRLRRQLAQSTRRDR